MNPRLIAYLITIAVLAMCLGFLWSRERYTRIECKKSGHRWVTEWDGEGDRLVCNRCGRGAR